jgi:hypothetical protein
MTLAGKTTGGGDVTILATTSASLTVGDHENTGDPNNSNKSDGDPIENNLTNVARRCLILQLQGDFRAEGKTSCRDCLRTKTLPCSRVVEVANGEIFSENENEKDTTENSSLQVSFSPSQILGKAYEILLDEYTNFLPPYPSNNTIASTKTTMTTTTTATTTTTTTTNTIRDDAATHPSSLQCMNRVSVILRFIQLLLLLSNRQQQQKSSSFPSTVEVNKMMVSLLEGWTHGICEFTRFCETINNSERTENDTIAEMDESNENENDSCLTANATLSLGTGPVFCYAFYSLLRMNEYIQTRGGLLVPLFKGLCELAKIMLVVPPSSTSISTSDAVSTGDDNREGTQKEEEDDEDDENDVCNEGDWRDHLPPNILGDAIRVLGDFLQEGKGRLELEAFQRCLVVPEEGGERSTHGCDARITFQGKFVGFMVTRMAHLLRVYFSVHEIFRQRLGEDSSSSSSSSSLSSPKSSGLRTDPFLNGVWRSLLGLRGLAASLQLLHSAGEIGTEKDKEIDVSFLKVYCEIAAKAGKCIADTILQKHQPHRQILIPGLESLLLSNMVTQGVDLVVDDDYHRHQEYQEEVRSNLIRISVLARTIGKVSVLQHILKIATSDGTCCRIPGNVEPLLATIEHFHSTLVPQCFSACVIAVRCSTESRNANAIVTTPTTIVTGSLKIMAETLRQIELSSEFMASPKRDSFYRLLVRWLAGNACNSNIYDKGSTNTNTGTTEFDQQQHPLSRELVLSLLHAHIVGYGRDSDKAQNEGGSQTRLLSYMTKLFMDARTGTALRRNIGALLTRLQSSPATSDSSMACVTATELIEKEFIAWLNHSRSRQRLSKKRKRTRCGQDVATGFDQQDVMVISRVLSAGRGISERFFSSSTSEEYQRILRKEFTRLSSDCTGESSKSGKTLLALADRNSLLLAWLERCVTMGPTTSFQTVRKTTGLDLLVDIVRPVLSAVSDLKFKLGRNGDGTELLKKKVMLYSAAMRLSVTWAIVFGDEGKLPIEKVCLLVKHSVSKDPWLQTNIEDARLSFVQDQQSILKFECLNLLGSIGKAVPSNCSERVLRVSNF